MALVLVAKNMHVDNPVGTVFLERLPPGLPEGLTRMHLMRRSLGVMNRNLAGASVGSFAEIHTMDTGSLSYDDISAISDWGTSGWYDPVWTTPYATGFTYMAVSDVGDDSTHLMLSSEYVSGASGLIRFDIQQPAMNLRMGNTDMGYARAEMPSNPGVPVLGFGAVTGSSGDHIAYLPHAGSYDTDSLTPPSPVPATLNGLLVGAGPMTAGHNISRTTRMYLVAQWGRVLDREEMDVAYGVVKEWLSAGGVYVA